jgi:hypothetical protein
MLGLTAAFFCFQFRARAQLSSLKMEIAEISVPLLLSARPQRKKPTRDKTMIDQN